MVLHSDAISQEGAAGEMAADIDGQDPDPHAEPAVSCNESIDQRTLARSGIAGDADDRCGRGRRGQEAQRGRPFWILALQQCDET
jgi:hypothetical protein